MEEQVIGGRFWIAGALLFWVGLRPAFAETDAEALQRAHSAMQSGGYSLAFDIYTRLDQSGSIEATRDLGQMYWGGRGITEDRPHACDLFAKAEMAGDAEATERLAVCFDEGQGRAQDYARSAELFERAAGRGVASAYCKLARHEQLGLGRQQDLAKAADLCRLGAELGDAFAQVSLGQMYLEGSGVTKDAAEALRWLEKAGRQQQPDANFLLGLHFWNGQGVDLDRQRAAAFFFDAATHGSKSAPAYLAKYYYLQGFGTPQRRDDQYQMRITPAPAMASLFWGIIAAGNDPDPDTRMLMIKHVRLITGMVPQLQAPVQALIAAGRWPAF